MVDAYLELENAKNLNINGSFELLFVFGLHILITCSIPSAQKSLISVLYSLHDCFFVFI